MARFLFGLLIVVTALTQATILPRINPFHYSVDLTLVFLFVWLANRSAREAFFWVFFTGILLDVLAVDYFGTNALALLIVAVLAGFAHQRVLQANVLIPMVLVGVATIIHGVVLALLRGDSPLIMYIPVQAALHVILVPVIYFVLRVFDR